MNVSGILAMRRTNPDCIAAICAYNAIRRGIQWLDAHAPVGWERNLFQPKPNGKSFFRAYTNDNTTSVLALAFESRPEFVDQYGYVSQYMIAEHFGLSFRDQFLLGFNAGWAFRNRQLFFAEEQPISITSRQLDVLWEWVIRHEARESLPFRYSSLQMLRREFRETFDALVGPRPTIKDRMLSFLLRH